MIKGGLIGSVVVATCPDIPPGQCCHAPAASHLLGEVTMSNLMASDIGAIWGRRTSPNGYRSWGITGCSSSLVSTRPGPGNWVWKQWDPSARPYPLPGVGGASYISLPEKLPPNPLMHQWLSAEGLLGLVWGGGSWFASPQAQNVLGGGPVGIKKARRDIRSKDKGNLWARPPMKEVFPMWIDINGSRYSDVGEGDFMYNSEAGGVLNLTRWFEAS